MLQDLFNHTKDLEEVEGRRTDNKALESEIEDYKRLKIKLDKQLKVVELDKKIIDKQRKNVGKGARTKAKILQQLKGDNINYKELSEECIAYIYYLTGDKLFYNTSKRA